MAAESGALIFSLTFVPAACALLLTGRIQEKDNLVVRVAKRGYGPLLQRILRLRWIVVGAAVAFVVICGVLAARMGAEFIPSLDEGDIAIEAIRPPGTGVEQGVVTQRQLDRAIGELPEVMMVFARNGTAEVATDLMPPARSDVYVMLKPREQWPDPSKTKAQLLADVEASASNSTARVCPLGKLSAGRCKRLDQRTRIVVLLLS